MKTKHLLIDERREQSIELAANILKQGELVAFPTETVYGLGADATNEQAVQKIFAAKGRPSDNPLIVHVATKEQLYELVTHVPAYVEKLIEAFAPGPITFVLKSNGTVANTVTAGLLTVAVRIPDHPVALALLAACKLPIAAPSANISGNPSPTTAEHVLSDLDGKIAAVLDGGASPVGVESTVIDCTGEVPMILRIGKITAEEIKTVVQIDGVGFEKDDTAKPKSPGTKYKHYAPEIPLWLVESTSNLQMLINEMKNNGHRVGALVSDRNKNSILADKIIAIGKNEEQMAANLYHALRSFKKEEVDLILCESFPTENVGKAVMDRIRRAASKIV